MNTYRVYQNGCDISGPCSEEQATAIAGKAHRLLKKPGLLAVVTDQAARELGFKGTRGEVI